MSVINIADRIQNLRKTKGISQEELAEIVGVSRQAVSKWESEQSTPDIEKIIMLSDYFGVSTDYLLKGIEPTIESPKKKVDARIFTGVGTVFNFIGLVVAINIWIEEQRPVAVAVGLILMSIGCMQFVIGQYVGKKNKASVYYFWMINIWFLSLIPISCIFNCVQGILGGYWWTFSPIPQYGNSLSAYLLCWFSYVALCALVDIAIILLKRKNRKLSQ